MLNPGGESNHETEFWDWDGSNKKKTFLEMRVDMFKDASVRSIFLTTLIYILRSGYKNFFRVWHRWGFQNGCCKTLAYNKLYLI